MAARCANRLLGLYWKLLDHQELHCKLLGQEGWTPLNYEVNRGLDSKQLGLRGLDTKPQLGPKSLGLKTEMH